MLFELSCWRRSLRVPWTAQRSNQSILKEISSEYSLEGLMLKLKLRYFGHRCEELTHLKRPWWWKRLKVGGEGDDRGWDGWMASLTQWTWVWVNSRSWWWTGRPGVLQSTGSQRVGHDWVTELNWTDEWKKYLNILLLCKYLSLTPFYCGYFIIIQKYGYKKHKPSSTWKLRSYVFLKSCPVLKPNALSA